MHQIRVLLSGLPRMLRDIVAELIGAQPDMDVVDASAVPALGAALPELARRVRPHVVIVGGGHDAQARSALGDALLRQAPELRVLALGADGRRAWLYEMRPCEVPLGEVSPAVLLTAIRGAAAREHAGREAAGRP